MTCAPIAGVDRTCLNCTESLFWTRRNKPRCVITEINVDGVQSRTLGSRLRKHHAKGGDLQRCNSWIPVKLERYVKRFVLRTLKQHSNCPTSSAREMCHHKGVRGDGHNNIKPKHWDVLWCTSNVIHLQEGRWDQHEPHDVMPVKK